MKGLTLLTISLIILGSVLYGRNSKAVPENIIKVRTFTVKVVEDSIAMMEKAFYEEKSDAVKLVYAHKLAAYYKEKKNFVQESIWLSQVFHLKKEPSNVDLFNWGYSCFNASDFKKADTVFCLYQQKYPTQSYGYYWAAKANAAIDTAMTLGLAIPHYQKLVDVCLKDSTNKTTRKWLITAYGYLAAYQANKFKNYKEASALYDKMLMLDPTNKDIIKNKSIIDKLAANGLEVK
jgi:tetratricopeptide (TPR) repeat protein